jgi:hypothetical protein
MVGDVGGTAAISLQVKTATRGWRNYRKNPEKSRWEWDVGPRSAKLCGEAIFYAFVDLNGGNGMPVVFIVPSAVVAAAVLRRGPKRRRFALRQEEAEEYREAWHLLTDRLVRDARLFDNQKSVSKSDEECGRYEGEPSRTSRGSEPVTCQGRAKQEGLP